MVLVLCAAATAIEGFDAQNIGYVAPTIIHEWHLPPHQFTPVFVSGLAGLLIGCLAIAPLADWLGRKWVLVGTLGDVRCFLFGFRRRSFYRFAERPAVPH